MSSFFCQERILSSRTQLNSLVETVNSLDAIQALFSAILATSRSFVEGYDLFKTIKKSTVSKRVSVSLPDLTHEKLQRWADIEGTSLADLAAYLLRRDVEQAEKEGKLNYPNEKK